MAGGHAAPLCVLCEEREQFAVAAIERLPKLVEAARGSL
jgi:hypothetical protein